jgi:UDP-glucose:(glucosyl)LPS alpha-1,3-glucosyltransferase/UDP-glucose:(galactosyl)LPS alpha-1,2-glucosyltransferase
MNIAICFDKNFQKWATVCLYSILEQHKNDSKIRLVILSDITYNQSIWQLKKVLKHFDFTFDNPGNDFDSMPTGYHFNVTTYWRLALPKVLSQYGIEKAIYLDTDVLVVDSLQELYNTNLNNKTCGGCIDIGSNIHVERMGLKQGFAINGGVLLMNVEKMNQCNWAEDANRLNQEGRIKWVDQDVINIVLDGKIELLDLKWNKQTGHFLHKYPDKPAIVHFTAFKEKKPCVGGISHPYCRNLLIDFFKSGFVITFFRYVIIKFCTKKLKKYYKINND